MPMFDFKCENCAHVWEALLPDSTTYPVSCPSCGSINFKRLLSVPYIIKSSSNKNPGTTCCGREERCASPPCSTNDTCHRK